MPRAESRDSRGGPKRASYVTPVKDPSGKSRIVRVGGRVVGVVTSSSAAIVESVAGDDIVSTDCGKTETVERRGSPSVVSNGRCER